MKRTLILLISIICFGCPGKDSKDIVNPVESIVINVKNPIINQVYSNNVEYELNTETDQDIKKVEYFLDGVSIGSVILKPYKFNWTPKDVDGGPHTIIVVVTSKAGNEHKAEIKVSVNLNLGDIFKGGKIFSIAPSGLKGLISMTNDMQIGSVKTFSWGYSKELLGTNDFDGNSNTIKMANSSNYPQEVGYHFKNGYSFNGYKDWYIPSRSELEVLKQNMEFVGGWESSSKDAYYWSSSEISATSAGMLNFVALTGNYQTKASYAYRIRPIRQF